MPRRSDGSFLDFGKRASAAAAMLGLMVLAMSVGPCQADWKFISRAEAEEVHGHIESSLDRIEGKIDLLTDINRGILENMGDQGE